MSGVGKICLKLGSPAFGLRLRPPLSGIRPLRWAPPSFLSFNTPPLKFVSLKVCQKKRVSIAAAAARNFEDVDEHFSGKVVTIPPTGKKKVQQKVWKAVSSAFKGLLHEDLPADLQKSVRTCFKISKHLKTNVNDKRAEE